MPDDIHTPDKSPNYGIRDIAPADKPVQPVQPAQPVDKQPWNKSRIEIEPTGKFSDRIKIPPMDERGKASPRALKGWPEGMKKA